ncbi:MAG TPA: hypothetical protein VFO93_06310 [Hymenobacter sp.]|uniref:hypothetical protein n=1 Tax=Hymenobacter sp. TaxID=1898978 RepID=UPI002D7EB061|nr:hypothetical protein [Hymenobacter sp.]HET9503133.1 hypothetical protein [Hymenobacter sp.]
MSYSRLTWSIEPKVVGVKDGVGPCYLDKEFYERNPWYTQIFLPVIPAEDWWKPRANMPDYGQALLQIPMEKEACHTDFIDFGGFQHGYIINNRLRELLEGAHLPRHRYLPASFVQGDNEITGYWWLCYDLETGKDRVDFAKSEFAPSRFSSGKHFSISSYSDYMQIIEGTGEAVQATKLCFNSSFDQELDIWGTQFLSGVKGYISDKLLRNFERHNITGYATRRLQCSLLFT